MRLEINFKNFKEFVKLYSLKKKSEILICIPTFNSFDITFNTINSFLEQKSINLDILITGPSGDIEKLIKVFPEINFCITKDNFGSSGNQLINIFISKENKYKYTVLTDNDAVLLDNYGLSKMLNLMNKEDLVWVTPILKYVDEKEQKNYLATIFHCCLFSNEIFNTLDYFFNPNYFLLFDDVSFTKRIEYSFPGRFKSINVKYYHPIKLNVISFQKKYAFFCTRSILIYLLREKFPLRYKLTFNYLRPTISILFIFLVKYGIDYLKIFKESLKQVIKDDYNLDYLKNIKESFLYEEVSKNQALKLEEEKIFKMIDNPFQTIIVPERFKFMDADTNIKFFKKV